LSSYIKLPRLEKGEKKKKILFSARVARWYIFKPKIPIWVNLGGH
jgi:hypothetical protein